MSIYDIKLYMICMRLKFLIYIVDTTVSYVQTQLLSYRHEIPMSIYEIVVSI